MPCNSFTLNAQDFTSKDQQNLASPFSFEELKTIQPRELQKPYFLTASDGIRLAYYPFVSKNPTALVIFYHGAGLYSNKALQWLAQELQEKYTLGCYLIDVRGHGHSEGIRGDTPRIEQVWHDVDTVVEHVKKIHPDIPLFLAGHSSGSGLLINYNAYGKTTDKVNGYLFLAPYLGPNSGTLKEHKNPEQNFVKKARVWVYILNSIFSWDFLKHIHAVFFNYPQYVLEEDPLIVTSYSYAMSSATTPYETNKLFMQLKKPFALYIGQDDEQFIPEKVVAFKKENSIAEIIPSAKHLSIFLQTPELIAKAIWLLKK